MEKSIRQEGEAGMPTRHSAAPELAAYLRERFGLPQTDLRRYSPLTLAFIGDDVYDLIVRTILVERGNAPVNRLNGQARHLVSAVAQSHMMETLEPLLTAEEAAVYKRGKNAKSATVSKNAPRTDYRTATGLEALCGYLYLAGRTERLTDLLEAGLAAAGELTERNGEKA